MMVVTNEMGYNDAPKNQALSVDRRPETILILTFNSNSLAKEATEA